MGPAHAQLDHSAEPFPLSTGTLALSRRAAHSSTRQAAAAAAARAAAGVVDVQAGAEVADYSSLRVRELQAGG